MTKHALFLALIGLLLIVSCQNTPNPPQTSQPSVPEAPAKSSAPDPNDLLSTLQGRWQSEQDPTCSLEFADTQMRHFNSGKLSHQSMIDVEGACDSPVCKPDSVDTSEGWCFTEMTMENGKHASQCNFVTLCDTLRLQYCPLSGKGTVLAFKKIQ